MHLRLTDGQFGALTPRQFYALYDRYQQQQEHNRVLFGVVAAAVGNFSANPPQRALKPSDFVRVTAKESKERKPVDKVARLRAFFMARTTGTSTN